MGDTTRLRGDLDVKGGIKIDGQPLSLADLDDVELTDPQDGDVLTFDEGTGKWVNQAGA